MATSGFSSIIAPAPPKAERPQATQTKAPQYGAEIEAGHGDRDPLHPPQDYLDQSLLTNVRGVYLAMKAEIPHMLAGGGGSIVVTSSAAVMVARPGLAAYAATKEALQGIVRAAALEYGEQGIRINALLPGITDTPLVRSANLDDAIWAQAKPALGQLNVDGLRRIAEAEEIAAAALTLASDDLAYMTGASLAVDGGLSAGRPIAIPEV